MSPAIWIIIGVIGFTLIATFGILYNIGGELIEARRETGKALREINKTLDAILKDARYNTKRRYKK